MVKKREFIVKGTQRGKSFNIGSTQGRFTKKGAIAFLKKAKKSPSTKRIGIKNIRIVKVKKSKRRSK